MLICQSNCGLKPSLTATFLINRLPSTVIGMESPFFKLHQQYPDCANLKVFGCKCFPYFRDRMSDKFQPKSYPCVFVGYSSLHKAFRCYHPPSRKICISRHVVFDENVLPYTNPRSLFVSSQDEQSITTYKEVLDWQNSHDNELLQHLSSNATEGENSSYPHTKTCSTEDNGLVNTPSSQCLVDNIQPNEDEQVIHEGPSLITSQPAHHMENAISHLP